MKRSSFLRMGATLALAPMAMKLQTFKKWVDAQQATDIMPALFIGHGSPMNAILRNEFNEKWRELGEQLPKPKAILSISAHWLTRGTYVTAMERPKTIHDFGGFPKDLFNAQYPSPGAQDMATTAINMVKNISIKEDHDWGLDHGTWSVLLPMYPEADIPVFQLSIDYYQTPQYHYDLAVQLSELRKKGVMIMGSGNIVHNLRMIDFEGRRKFDWAYEFDEKIKTFIEEGNIAGVINYHRLGNIADMAVPTNDHYLPLLYSLAVKGKKDEVAFFNDKMDAGSISMRSLLIG